MTYRWHMYSFWWPLPLEWWEMRENRLMMIHFWRTGGCVSGSRCYPPFLTSRWWFGWLRDHHPACYLEGGGWGWDGDRAGLTSCLTAPELIQPTLSHSLGNIVIFCMIIYHLFSTLFHLSYLSLSSVYMWDSETGGKALFKPLPGLPRSEKNIHRARIELNPKPDGYTNMRSQASQVTL
jgi:hypothetical protein